MNICKRCKKEITDYTPGQVMHPHCAIKEVKENKSCRWCKGEILEPRENKVFCSEDCSNKFHKNRENKIRKQRELKPKVINYCLVCGVQTQGRRKTCSDEHFKIVRSKVIFNRRAIVK